MILRLSILLFLFAFNKGIVAQSSAKSNDSILFWQSDLKLSWDDFKGDVPNKTRPANVSAIMDCGIRSSHKYWDGDTPIFEVKAYMKTYTSWSLVSDSLSLKHEKGHFDIHEIYARKIRKSFDSLNHLNVNNVQSYKDIFNKHFVACDEVNEKYEYSNFNEMEQKKWNKKISEKLLELSDYKSSSSPE